MDVTLQPLSVLLGPNSAGKSNFLDVLQLLSRIATCRTLRDAFEPPYRGKPLESFAFGRTGVQGMLEQDSASFVVEVDVELSNAVVASVNRQVAEMRKGKSDGGRHKNGAGVRERHLRYRVEIEILPRSGILRVSDEYLAALNKKGEVSKARAPLIERVGERLHLRMEGQAHPTYHERYLDHSMLSLPLYVPHYPHVVAMREELASWLFFYLEPRERMRAATAVKETRHIGLMGEDLAAFLNTLQALDPRQFNAVEKALHMMIPSIEAIRVGVNLLGEVELQLIENGVAMPARVLSEGTLRMLGLLALGGARQPPALVGFEEPENGIHPRRIAMVADLLKNRASTGDTQLIVTTHSPVLLDHIEDTDLFVCRKRKGATVVEPFSTWGPPLSRTGDIDDRLNAEPTSVSERVQRGDFDG